MSSQYGFIDPSYSREMDKTEDVPKQILFNPYVEIAEQPASKGLRFRYECEGRSAGSIPGVRSTPEHKTYPSIRIAGYEGRAMVVVSCVTKDFPHKPHPHSIVGKEGCRRGVCSMKTLVKNSVIPFPNLGIQCVKKKDITSALNVRQEIRVDPFGTGFDHKNQPSGIDLNVVRLCFQVFLEGSRPDKYSIPLKPVVTDPIYDKKAVTDLMIYKMSHASASVAGGLEMILLCERITKEDIQIRFFEEKDGQVVWEGFGEFTAADVFKQVAVIFRTPKYHKQQIDQPVLVHIQLRRPSDNCASYSVPFTFDPLSVNADDSNSRKRKMESDTNITDKPVQRNVQAKTEKLLPDSGMTNEPYNYNDNIEPESLNKMLGYGGAVRNNAFPVHPMPTLTPQAYLNLHAFRPPLPEYAKYNASLAPMSSPYEPQQYPYANQVLQLQQHHSPVSNAAVNKEQNDLLKETQVGTQSPTQTNNPQGNVNTGLNIPFSPVTTSAKSESPRSSGTNSPQGNLNTNLNFHFPPVTTSADSAGANLLAANSPQGSLNLSLGLQPVKKIANASAPIIMNANSPQNDLNTNLNLNLGLQPVTKAANIAPQNLLTASSPQSDLNINMNLDLGLQAVTKAGNPNAGQLLDANNPDENNFNTNLNFSLQPVTKTGNTQGGNPFDSDNPQGSLNASLNQLDSEELAVFGTLLSEKLWSGLSISDPDLEKDMDVNSEENTSRPTSTPFPEPMNLQTVYKHAVRNDGGLAIT